VWSDEGRDKRAVWTRAVCFSVSANDFFILRGGGCWPRRLD